MALPCQGNACSPTRTGRRAVAVPRRLPRRSYDHSVNIAIVTTGLTRPGQEHACSPKRPRYCRGGCHCTTIDTACRHGRVIYRYTTIDTTVPWNGYFIVLILFLFYVLSCLFWIHLRTYLVHYLFVYGCAIAEVATAASSVAIC